MRKDPIPKEAPWKTLVLNEQFREKRNGEFSTTTSGTERERGFVGIGSFRSEPLFQMFQMFQIIQISSQNLKMQLFVQIRF